ncbi:MAG: TadE/TadG family type IV pilus assembly protein [Pseudomonadota bacterium]
MSSTLKARLIARARLRRLRKDEAGVSAVEFAIIAPFMALLFFGCIELSMLMQAERKVTSTASTLGDLVARSIVVDSDDLDDIFAASAFVVQPLDSSQARLRVTSVIDNEGVAEVDWSEASTNWSARSEGSAVSLPAGVLAEDTSVIYAEVEYDYTSPLGFFLKGEQGLTEEFYVRPRRVNAVTYED